MDSMGGTSANVITATYADDIGSTGGAETQSINLNNLPEHEHDMRGDSGDQYYALRDISGTPNDADAIIYDAPSATGNGQALSNSGGVLNTTGNPLGDPLNIMNPTLTMSYIIYTGRD
jgi:microcystin-dependent protein